MLDLLLEFAHHLAAFALVGVLVAEYMMIAPGLSGERLRRVGMLDAAYGGLATLIVVVGFARVFWGEAGYAFYVMNWVFWAKIALFVAVAILSIQPTLMVLTWRRAARADPAFAVPAPIAARLRRVLLGELVLFAFIPIFAAMMARGIGLN